MALADTAILNQQASAAPMQMLAYLRRRNPALPESEAWEIVNAYRDQGALWGIDPAAAFAQAMLETNSFKFGGQVHPNQHNPAGIAATNDGKVGSAFATWEAGVAAHYVHLLAWTGDERGTHDPRRALVDLAAKDKGYARTWRDLGGRWAVGPRQDTYGDGIEAHWQGIIAEEARTMGHVPRPSITNHIVAMPPRQDGVGLNVNGWQRIPRGTVLHSMGGTLRGTDGYFQQPSCPALTDFGIGQVDHGGGFAQIIQWCDYRGTIEPWASGPVRQPEGDGPRFLAAWGGAEKLNEAGISIEHDDTTRADGGTLAAGGAPVTAYQWASSVWLQAYLHAEELGQTADTFDWNMHHLEFCGRTYKTCPNPRITAYTDEYQAAVKAIMRHFQEGTPYPADGLVVNGLHLALPPEGAMPPQQPTDPGFPGIVQPDQSLVINGQVVPDGRAVTAERLILQVRNEGGERYNIEWDAHRWEGWRTGPIPLP